MPTYTFRCRDCGQVFDKFLKLADYEAPQVCSCGAVAERKICAPAIRADYPGYSCPVTGKWIEGRRAHTENLAQQGCRVFEPGEKEALIRRKAAEEERFEKSLDETTESLLANLPSRKMEKLVGEIEGGMTATVVRQ